MMPMLLQSTAPLAGHWVAVLQVALKKRKAELAGLERQQKVLGGRQQEVQQQLLELQEAEWVPAGTIRCSFLPAGAGGSGREAAARGGELMSAEELKKLRRNLLQLKVRMQAWGLHLQHVVDANCIDAACCHEHVLPQPQT
jgi:hypothetical protein